MSGSQATRAVAEEEPGADERVADGAATRPRRWLRGNGSGALQVRRAPAGAGWDERCAVLFEDLRKPARVMVGRAFGSAFSADEIEDVYANAWASTLAALRGREHEMSDEELRSYLLTAVANHASKEMRRRRRKPTGALEETHAQVLFDRHQLTPDERVVGSETGSQARDLLASLPPRRRAVMLLRYGWGLEPKEVCRLIDGLSPRAYRKEITRGVEQMIDRFRRLESGEWCETREPLLRDYVAGVADADAERQALEHIAHCRHCNELVGRLSAGLHELGGAGVAWTMLAGALGESRDGFAERLAEILERVREAPAAGPGEGAASQAVALAGSGAGRGAGAAGAGLFAKLAGLGAAGKVAVACLGAGTIGGACLATGLVEAPGGSGPAAGDRAAPIRVEAEPLAGAIVSGAQAEALAVETDRLLTTIARRQRQAEAERRERREELREQRRAEDEQAASVPLDGSTDTAGAPSASPAPTAPAAEQEFGLPSTTTPPAAATPGPGDSGAGAGDVAGEFGP